MEAVENFVILLNHYKDVTRKMEEFGPGQDGLARKKWNGIVYARTLVMQEDLGVTRLILMYVREDR